MKTCYCCKETKPFEEFSKKASTKDGYYPYCKVCKKVKDKESYEKHKAARYLVTKAWQEKNTEKYKSYKRKWDKNNKAVKKAWSDSNRDKINARGREWKKANKAKVQCDTRMRQARKAKATPSWADKQEIQYYYNLAVYFTEMSGGFVKYHVDHIVPLRGKDVCGLHVQNNLQVLKSVDNLRKSNKCHQA